MRVSSAWVLAITGFLINPSCSSAPPQEEFEFGESDMVRAVEGSYRLTYGPSTSESVITFKLAQGPAAGPLNAGVPERSPLCAHRDFIRPAGACIISSALSVKGTVETSTDKLEDTDVSGTFTAFGRTYAGGNVDLHVSTSLHVSFEIDANDGITIGYTDAQAARVPSSIERL